MAGVALENWVERIRDPKIECMSRDEMADLQSKRLVDVVKRVYENVDFYRKNAAERCGAGGYQINRRHRETSVHY